MFIARTLKEINEEMVKLALFLGSGAPAAPTPPGPPSNPIGIKIPVDGVPLWPILDFDPYIYDNEEPPCLCDVKRLVSYGCEDSCGYKAWKARRMQ